VSSNFLANSPVPADSPDGLKNVVLGPTRRADVRRAHREILTELGLDGPAIDAMHEAGSIGDSPFGLPFEADALRVRDARTRWR
jgi:hypothetical protein